MGMGVLLVCMSDALRDHKRALDFSYHGYVLASNLQLFLFQKCSNYEIFPSYRKAQKKKNSSAHHPVSFVKCSHWTHLFRINFFLSYCTLVSHYESSLGFSKAFVLWRNHSQSTTSTVYILVNFLFFSCKGGIPPCCEHACDVELLSQEWSSTCVSFGCYKTVIIKGFRIVSYLLLTNLILCIQDISNSFLLNISTSKFCLPF